jgi:hypothetical protein
MKYPQHITDLLERADEAGKALAEAGRHLELAAVTYAGRYDQKRLNDKARAYRAANKAREAASLALMDALEALEKQRAEEEAAGLRWSQ